MNELTFMDFCAGIDGGRLALDNLGKWKLLNSLDYGVAQMRERIYFSKIYQ